MSQTSYSNEMTEALAGLIATGFEPNIKTFAAQEDINFGLALTAGTDVAKQVTLPHPGRTLVFDAVLVTGNIINMTVNGASITPVPFNGDNLTTLGDLATELALQPGVSSTSVVGTDTVIVENSAGFDISILSALVTGGASQANIAVSATNFHVFKGVGVLDQAVQQDSNGDALYPTNSRVNVLTQGTVWCAVEGSVSVDDSVAFLTTLPPVNGRFVSGPGSDPSSVVPGAVFRSANIEVDGQQIAQIEFNLPA